MATAQPHGSSLAQDLAQIWWNNIRIEDYKKTVKLLEQKPPTPVRVNVIHSYKYHILQLETEKQGFKGQNRQILGE